MTWSKRLTVENTKKERYQADIMLSINNEKMGSPEIQYVIHFPVISFSLEQTRKQISRKKQSKQNKYKTSFALSDHDRRWTPIHTKYVIVSKSMIRQCRARVKVIRAKIWKHIFTNWTVKNHFPVQIYSTFPPGDTRSCSVWLFCTS